VRHCERQRSNPALNAGCPWIASSLPLLATTPFVSSILRDAPCRAPYPLISDLDT
jgi:hypothetical protein